MSAPDFSKFTQTRKKKIVEGSTEKVSPVGLKHLQVRLTKPDAIRLRRAAEDRDLSLQSALIEAINLLMDHWGDGPVDDPGTVRNKS